MIISIDFNCHFAAGATGAVAIIFVYTKYGIKCSTVL